MTGQGEVSLSDGKVNNSEAKKGGHNSRGSVGSIQQYNPPNKDLNNAYGNSRTNQ